MIRFLLRENKLNFFTFIFIIFSFFVSFNSFGQIKAVTIIKPITSICPQEDVTIEMRISNDANTLVSLNGVNLHLDIFDQNSNLYLTIDTTLTTGSIQKKSVKDIIITQKADFLKLGVFTYKMVASLPSDTKTGYDNEDETIAVIDNELTLLTGGTNAQEICLGDNIANIIYQGGGITDLITVSTLPTGLVSNYDASTNQFTISGKPTTSGSYNYSITAKGTCPQDPDGIKNDSTLVASLQVKSLPNVSITGSKTLCVNETSQLSPSLGGTWSSSNSVIASVSSPAGLVTGKTPGKVVFTFTSETSGCSATTDSIQVIGRPIVAGITGNSSVCKNESIDLSSTTSGGVWTSSIPSKASVTLKSDNGSSSVATVKGLIDGVPNATISYTVTINGCSTTRTKSVSVSPLPTISKTFSTTGKDTVCINNSIILQNSTIGGTWSVKDASIATINSPGLNNIAQISGVAVGKTEVYYSKNDGCTNVDTLVMNVIALPSTGLLTGASSICEEDTIQLSSTINGGSWSSANSSIATVDAVTGQLIGVSSGSVTLYYTVDNGICTNTDSIKVTVKPLPIVSQINGTNNMCLGTSVTFSNTNKTGTWSSTKSDVASVNSTTGLVTPIKQGITTIKYLVVDNGCSVEKTIDVNVFEVPSVSPIIGANSICLGDSLFYTNASSGGTWSVLDPSIFKVTSQGKITALKQGSTILNYSYTVNGCTALATKTILVNSLPIVKANATSLELCKGTTVTLL